MRPPPPPIQWDPQPEPTGLWRAALKVIAFVAVVGVLYLACLGAVYLLGA